MNKEQFEALRAKQDLSVLHYPDQIDNIWSYCLFLGKFTDSKGRNYDLGVHYDESFNQFSLANIFGNESQNYHSGIMNYNVIPDSVNNEKNVERKTLLDLYAEKGFENYVECWNRLQNLLLNI